jgi:hypothetical protein
MDAGPNSAPHLRGQRCRDHEDRGDSSHYRKLAEQCKVECTPDLLWVAPSKKRRLVVVWRMKLLFELFYLFDPIFEVHSLYTNAHKY